MRSPDRVDIVLAGGGLANGLIAWTLRALRPELRVLLLESGPTLGGNHTWSFHDSDLDAAQRERLAPFVTYQWRRHTVAFDSHVRRLDGGYASISSERFHDVLLQSLGDAVRLDTPLAEVRPTSVRTLRNGLVEARAVIDGRGFRPSPFLKLAYQKFVGLEFELDAPHGLAEPILMDARVPQLDGYRFVYTLPLAPDRVLIEDTYYANFADLDRRALVARIGEYAAARGWRVRRTLREESGVLPIALDGDIDAFLAEAPGQPVAGMRAALFHPTTGYSLPQAMRLAELIARTREIDAPRLAATIAAHARRSWQSQAFFRALNRMLFRAGRPQARHRVLAHFYRLPERLVERFYADRLSAFDKLRIVSGRPPVPIGSAIKAIVGRTASA